MLNVEQSRIEAVEAALRMGYNLPPLELDVQFGTLHPENLFGSPLNELGSRETSPTPE
jgi:hypothetical protein